MRKPLWIMCVLAIAAAPLAAQDQPDAAPTPADPALLEQVRAAYRDTQQYRAVVTFTVEQTAGRITQMQRMELFIAFDRAAQRLTIDKPDVRLVIDGGQMRMSHYQAANHYVEAPLASPIEWHALIAAMPLVKDPPLPDVAFLIAADPANALARPSGAIVAGDRPGTLAVNTDAGLLTLVVDPATHLIAAAELKLGGASAGKLTYVFDIRQHNQPIDAEAFKFDSYGGQAVASINELANAVNSASGAAGGPANDLSDQAKALLNNAVPKVTFKTIDGQTITLGETGHRLVLIDFWGTWCIPCHLWLPVMQQVHDWAAKENLSVLVVAANYADQADAAEQFWKDKGYTVPMTLDADGALFGTFVPIVFPQTFVILDGKLVNVHGGAPRDAAAGFAMMQKEITDLLAPGSNPGSNPDSPSAAGGAQPGAPAAPSEPASPPPSNRAPGS